MLTIRRAEERGHFDHGWLNTYHSFSFSDYFDPKHMGFSVLRVINEDKITGGEGFPTHPHRDMEIITYIVEGALEHRDTLGNNTIIKPGEVQRMTAGTGIRHSEFNHFGDKSTHLLQIWILPQKINETPGYDQKSFAARFEREHFILVAAPGGENNSVSLNQDVRIYVGKFKAPTSEIVEIKEGRTGWIQVIKGKLNVSGHTTKGALIEAGDGLAIQDERKVEISSHNHAEFLYFDMPPVQ